MSNLLADHLDLDARRAHVRADAALASRVVPIARPLDEFVAVNPLAGFEELPFADAIDAARPLYGLSGYLAESRYRRMYHQGRITDADLRWAIRTRGLRIAPSAGRAIDGCADPVEDRLIDELLTAAIPEPRRRSIRTAADRLDRSVGSELAEAVDQHAIRWCAAYLGTEAGWRLPGREQGLYHAWRHLVVHDPTLDAAARRRLATLANRSDDAVLRAAELLGIDPDEHRSVFEAELTALPGWTAHIRWRAQQHHDIDLVDYLAVRLSYLAALTGGIQRREAEGTSNADEPSSVPSSDSSRPGHTRASTSMTGEANRSDGDDTGDRVLEVAPERRPEIWQAAFERGYRSQLLDRIDADPPIQDRSVDPDAQIVCCIDARSEGLRRAVEAQGRYETLGFAGFFGIAISWGSIAGGEPVASCPALVSPRHAVNESAVGSERALQRYHDGIDGEGGAFDALHDAKATPGAGFVLAEAAGWITGPAAALRTLAPSRWSTAARWVHRRAVTEPASAVDLGGIPLADRILTARSALTTMGLARFAPLVVLCGHTSWTAANPYEAALRCGACGGHTGGPNARVLAAILNDSEVRDAIREGPGAFAIPTDTVFLAAEHDTTSDTVTVLDRGLVPPTHRERLDRLAADLDSAGERHAEERCAALPGAPKRLKPSRARRHVRRRGSDWAETFPEWGLAGNAAFVVGPRSLTAGRDLERRVFLHSYDPVLDRDGLALETILTAPLIVAQWINCQYYFSSTDPEVFGSGTKTVHNAIGTIGVLAGRTGDLRLGLPQQSVALGGELVHEPLRLFAVVQAPLARIAGIIDRNQALRHLVAGEWISVVARGDVDEGWARWTEHGWIDDDGGAGE